MPPSTEQPGLRMVRGLSLPICKWGGVWWGWKRVSAPSPCLLAQDQALIGDEVGAFEGGPGMRDVAWGGGIMTLGACTWQRRVVQEGSRGRQNFFMELTAAGKAGAEKMAATRLIDPRLAGGHPGGLVDAGLPRAPRLTSLQKGGEGPVAWAPPVAQGLQVRGCLGSPLTDGAGLGFPRSQVAILDRAGVPIQVFDTQRHPPSAKRRET